jgi:ABC-2 type transport system permease protein
MILWLPLLACLLVVRYYSNDPTVLDPGTIVTTYLGILLFGALYLSIGVFASAITRSQIIAAMVTFAFGITLFMASFLPAALSTQTGWQAQLIGHLSLMEHMRDFASGVVDSRPVVFYLSVTILFLVLTWRVTESRRWK